MTLLTLPASIYSSTPPLNPVDGQEWIYPVAAGVNWRFRYNQSSGSSFKWEFIGGPALMNAPVTGSASLHFTAGAGGAGTNTNWLSDATAPTLTVARAGEYQTVLSGVASLAQATGETRNVYEGLMKQDGGVGSFLYSGFLIAHGFQSIGWQSSPGYLATEWSIATAGSVLQMWYGADAVSAVGVNYTFSSRMLSLLPKRIS